MGRSADDLALGLAAMAGADEIDGAGWQLRLPPPRRKSLHEYRVAVMLTDPNSDVDLAVQDRLQALADFLAKKHVTVSDRARPDVDTGEAHRVYIQLLRAATSGRQSAAEFEKNLATAQTLAPGDHSYFAQMTRANTLHHRDWLAANETRHRMRLKWAEFFTEWDLLLCPPAASAAFPHDHAGERHERTIEVNGQRVPTVDQLFWAGLTGMVYLPASVAPIGLTPAGLPVGVQIAGPQYGDRMCIAFARHLEQEYRAFVPPPGY
jgi:amidase